ncbi:helix-turn-helix domain-containing protein [uncultured Corynebacterium sp.]|uniref:helix-turn-helix transcriptional regulator n=1 Tax=uncultured Corynebacterium sp. TaxID=159447 RepID=UPI0025FC1C8B|nr:helix-turn-helix domain-containing protein [uncultured Corynebacterium sp.]
MSPATTTLRAAADLLGISKSSAYAAARNGTFPTKVIQIGGRYVVPTNPLLELLELDELPKEVA